ncbi:unnamed protein product [Soboliphyme baturini]|uniref:Uncharacterized protein n=1 Tax=Soboliphyme baturini TaxID=241478 RepID=A0A183ITS4_9BILA|nr:unnamed protein product [Soboliphyme baturini]
MPPRICPNRRERNALLSGGGGAFSRQSSPRPLFSQREERGCLFVIRQVSRTAGNERVRNIPYNDQMEQNDEEGLRVRFSVDFSKRLDCSRRPAGDLTLLLSLAVPKVKSLDDTTGLNIYPNVRSSSDGRCNNYD